jgi:hypothetical protein
MSPPLSLFHVSYRMEDRCGEATQMVSIRCVKFRLPNIYTLVAAFNIASLHSSLLVSMFSWVGQVTGTYKAIAHGGLCEIAVRGDGTLRWWGTACAGDLVGSSSSCTPCGRDTAMQASYTSRYKAVAAGLGMFCAIREDDVLEKCSFVSGTILDAPVL